MNRRTIVLAVAAALAGLGLGGLWNRFYLQPKYAASTRRYETARDVLVLYGMQKRYKSLHGVYANDVDSLLTVSPEGAAFKARLAGHMDMSTLTVVGDRDHFKIEANALDGLRSLVKIKGPIADAPLRRPEAPLLPVNVPDANLDPGAPIRR